MSRRSTAPLEAVILPDLPPPRGNRWRVVLVGAAFLACLAVIVGVLWGIGTLATTARRAPSGNPSLVEHWEEPAQRLASLKRAMTSSEVGASAAELRDFYRLLTRVTNACRTSDRTAFLACFDLNLLVRRISQHPQVRDDRNFSPWAVKAELEAGLTPFAQVGEFSIVRVERGQHRDQALVYTVDWDHSLATACRWWLVRDGRNWRIFDWERLDLEQSLAHTWAIRDAVNEDPHAYNYTVLRGAIDSTPHVPGGRMRRPRQPAGADLASLIDDPLPEAIHDAALFDLAWALIGQGRPSDAIKAANALSRPQDHPGYLIIRARAYSDLGRYAQALADAQQYERLAGSDPLALDQAATALAHLNRHREAAECWRTMLRLAPNHDEALTNFCRLADADQRNQLGEILGAARQPIESAVSQAQSAIFEDDLELFEQLAGYVARAAPDSPAAIAIQAQRLAYDGQHQQAAAQYKRASDAEFRPDKKSHYFDLFLDAQKNAGKIAEGYAAATDPQVAFDYFTAGWEDDEADLTDAQLKVLLAAHKMRVPGDARADYLEGQLLLRAEDYAQAEVKFQAAIDGAEEDDQEHYRDGRIEALVHLDRGLEAYESLGRNSAAFRKAASHLDSNGRFEELKTLIERHRALHAEDRWIDYYQAFYHRERGEIREALAAIQRAEQGEERLKAFCRHIKQRLLVEADQMHVLLASPENRRQVILDLARDLTSSEDWLRLDQLDQMQAPLLGSDADFLNAWTEALVRQGRLDEAAKALSDAPEFTAHPLPSVQNELAMREVRCLLRLGRRDDARKAAERAAQELGLQVPLVMVHLAEGNLTALRAELSDPAVPKAVLEQPVDQDPELVQLLLHPDLADLRSKLEVPLAIYASEPNDELILLLSQPLALTEADLAERLARIGMEGASILEVPRGADNSRRSYRIEHEQNTLQVTIGSGPYWKPGNSRRLPFDPQLAKVLEEHRGYVVVECIRTPPQPGQQANAALARMLAAELCGEGALAVHGPRPQTIENRLVAVDEKLTGELSRGEFLGGSRRAGIEFFLNDELRYPEDDSRGQASAETIARRRAATQLARQVAAGMELTGQVRAEMWHGHARESVWLEVVAARREAYGRWQLIGALTADSALRPALTKGTRIVLQPYEVLEIQIKGISPITP